MGVLALILGILGGLCAVMGVITAAEAAPLVTDALTGFTGIFWLALAGVLFLAAITSLMARTPYEG